MSFTHRDAARVTDVQLTIGHRLQHDPNNQAVMRYAKEKTRGAVREVETGAGYDGTHSDPGDWHRGAELGGRTLCDTSVYPINAIRSIRNSVAPIVSDTPDCERDRGGGPAGRSPD